MLKNERLAPFLKSQNRRLVSRAFVLQVATAGFSYLAMILIARFMPVEEFGKYTYLNTWVMVVAILSGFGLPQAIVQLIGKYGSTGDSGKSWVLIGFSYKFCLLLSVLAALVMYFVCTRLGSWEDAWILCALMVPIFAVTNLQVGLGRVVEKVATALIITHVLRHLIVILVVLVCLYLGLSSTANELLFWVAVGSVIALIFQGKSILKGFDRSAIEVDFKEKIGWIKGASPFLGLTAGVFLIEQIDLLLIGVFKGEKEVALYAVASKIAYLVSFVYVAMTTALAPKLSRLYHSGDFIELRVLVRHGSRLMMAAACVIGFGLAVSSDVILSLLGDHYLPVKKTLLILIFAHVILSVVGLADSLLNMTGRQFDTFKIYLISIFSNICITIVLLPMFGLIGAATGHLVSKVIFVIGVKIIVRKIKATVSANVDVNAASNQHKYTFIRLINFIRGLLISLIFLPLKKDKNRIIFCGSHNNNYNFNSKYLFEYVIEKYPHLDCKMVINNAPLRERLEREIGPYFIDNKKLANIIYILGAQSWVTSTLETPMMGIMQAVNRKVYYLSHGPIFKNAGLLENDISWLKRIYYAIVKFNFSYIFTTSEGLVPFAAKMHDVGEEQVAVIGQPKNDWLFKPPEQELTAGVQGKKILYAPTWRKHEDTALFPFKDFDVDALNTALAAHNIHIYFKLHPFYEREEVKRLLRSHIHLILSADCGDISAHLLEFDLLVTDYSSLFIDFMVLNRPLIFLPYDLEEYMFNNGFIRPYQELTPGPKPETQKEFIDSIVNVLGVNFQLPEEYIKANQFFNAHKDDQNCERSIRFIAAHSGFQLTSKNQSSQV